MLLKCETRSFRVKGLAFHPQHPWVLVSLHNGAIQLWDYHLGALFDKFEGHEGPVRGVDFHGSQPIFASGGDDFKVIVWSYRTRQMQFALLGHLDYIRTVQFHHESPWLLSASDDQTVRIWNWQNRNCISILAGHNHYVMCAQFHPSQDILLTASLDQTVRVWDIEGLREKHDSRAGNSGAPVDLFGTSDAICRFVIEDHDRGVNWACFHPTLPLIASASDDRVVRLWRYSGAKWWNVWSFRGHFNNVSCVAFHPTKELLISNSEDKTIRIWDINKRTMLHSYRREHDRFWVLAVKPNSDVVAVGHDTGMVVFKLERERVPHAIPAHDTRLFVVKDEWLTIRDIHSQLEQQIVQITKPYTQCITSCQINPYNGPNSGTTLLYFICVLCYLCSLSHPGAFVFLLLLEVFKTSDIQVLVTHQPTGEDSGPTYHDIVVSNNAGGFQQMFKTYRSEALAAAFLNRQRLAMLTSSTTLSVVSTVLEAVKRVEISLPVSKIFPAGSGRLLLLEEDDATMHLFDVATARCLSSISAPYGGVKEVKWALDGVHFGAMSRHHVILGSVVGDTVKVLGTHHETLRIKSICFDETSTCLYFCTLDHVKYLLEGDLTGILQAVKDAAVYMLRVEQGFLHAISRDAPIFAKQLVGTVEPQLKAALREKRFDKVALFIRNGRLCGNSLVAHLKQSGHADVALMFVEDCTTKFHLALEIGNLKVAEACAIELDEKSFWHKLGLDALTLGNFEMAEASFQKARSFNDLMLMYVMSGHTEKLGRLQQLFKKLDDPLGVFTASLLNNEPTARAEVVSSLGHSALAAAIRLSNGLPTDSVDRAMLDAVTADVKHNQPLELPERVFIAPVKPSSATNWPGISEVQPLSSFDLAMQQSEGVTSLPAQVAPPSSLQDAAPQRDFTAAWNHMDLSAWDDDVTVPFDDERPPAKTVPNARLPSALQRMFDSGSKMPADLILLGDYKGALNLLQHRVGLVNAEPLRDLAKQLVFSTCAYLPGSPMAESLEYPILSSGSKRFEPEPLLPFGAAYFERQLATIYKLFQTRNTDAGLATATTTLQAFTLAVADEEEFFLTALKRAAAYKLQFLLERAIKSAEGARRLELITLAVSLDLLPAHRLLVLQRALGELFKEKAFRTCAEICKAIINGDFQSVPGLTDQANKAVAGARQVLGRVENNAVNALDVRVVHISPETSVVCAKDLKQLPGDAAVCPYCGAHLALKYSHTLCPLCEIAEVGVRCLGLQLKRL